MQDDLVVSTKDHAGVYDAIATAKPGEPLFPLQGGDPHAPPTVLHWVALYRAEALTEENPEKRAAMLRKATAAEQVAWAMQAYQRGHAEELEGQRASYNDHADTSVDRIAILVHGCRRLDNALAEILDFADKIESLGDMPTVEGVLREIAERIKLLSGGLEPRQQVRD